MIELGRRELTSFLVVSAGLHLAAALLVRRPERVPPPPLPPALIFEMLAPSARSEAPATELPVAARPSPAPPPAAPPAKTDAKPKVEPLPKPAAKPSIEAASAPAAKPAERDAAKAEPNAAATPEAVAPSAPAAPAASARAAEAAAQVRARYEDLLRSWLLRFEYYPSVVRRRRMEGTVVVAIRVDRRGRVLSSRIARSSGFETLDGVATAMVHRADPFPAMPDDYEGESFDFDAGVEFRLR